MALSTEIGFYLGGNGVAALARAYLGGDMVFVGSLSLLFPPAPWEGVFHGLASSTCNSKFKFPFSVASRAF